MNIIFIFSIGICETKRLPPNCNKWNRRIFLSIFIILNDCNWRSILIYMKITEMRCEQIHFINYVLFIIWEILKKHVLLRLSTVEVESLIRAGRERSTNFLNYFNTGKLYNQVRSVNYYRCIKKFTVQIVYQTKSGDCRATNPI